MARATRSWPYILVGLGVLGVGVAAWRPVPAGVWHDDGVYMLMGEALAQGHGLVYEGVAGTPPAAKFPPLYPVVLALLWRLFGDIGPVTMAATLLNVAFLAVAAGLFTKALAEGAGMSIRASAAVAGLAFVSTDLVRTALVPLSEPMFVMLVAAALALWSRVRPRPAVPDASGEPDGEAVTMVPTGPDRSAVALLALVLVATVATRTAGLSVVLAFAMAFALSRRLGLAAVATGPALLAAFLWSRWSAAATAEIPEGARDLLGSYGGWWADQTVGAPGAFLADLPVHAFGVLGRAAAVFIPAITGPVFWIAALVVAPFVAFGIWLMIRRLPPLGWLTLGYLAMLLLWPYLDRRLVAPWHPMVLACAAAAASDLFRRLGPGTFRNALVGAAAVWVVVYSSVTAFRVADGWPTANYRVRSEHLANALQALERTLPEDAVVGAPEFWAALHLHGGWTVAPSVRFDPRSVDPDAPLYGTPDEQIDLWRESGIDHLLLEQGGQLHGAALDQLEAACPGMVRILAQMPSAIIIRLDWDAVCEPDVVGDA